MCVPNDGSVMFCEATTPGMTKKSSCRTGGRPSSAPRANRSRGTHRGGHGDDGNHIDLDQPLRARESGHYDAGRDGEYSLEPPTNGAIHRFAKTRIRQINCDLADMLEAGARLA